jgi:hypothetical protein
VCKQTVHQEESCLVLVIHELKCHVHWLDRWVYEVMMKVTEYNCNSCDSDNASSPKR